MLIEYYSDTVFPRVRNMGYFAVRTDRWKYIRYPHGDGSPDRHLAELYDLSADPGETRNLAADPRHAATVAQLRTELARVMADAGLTPATDKMPLDAGIGTALPDAKIR